MTAREEGLWVAVPERLDRRLRLGPFASGRDAVKFVAAAAVGAVVSLAVAPWAGVPIAGAGAVVALWRPDGDGLDERLVVLVRWAVRRSRGFGTMTGAAARGPEGGRSIVRLRDGRSAALLRASGVPLAFLPPAELAVQFERFRELLRSLDGTLIVVAGASPIFARAVLPADGPLPADERTAREGYRELVALLARRRSVRTVVLAIARPGAGAEGMARLEAAADLLQARLADLGVRAARLAGRPLAEAARRIGWPLVDGRR
jgi:hypothetical protein